jgi:TonB family protein
VARRTGRLDTAAAPQIAETTKNVGTDLTQANAPHVAQPAPIPSNAAAVAPHRTARSESAAPEIGAQSNGNPADVRKLVAISANPAPPSSDVKIPQGNLAANISLSPDGARPGSPGGADRGTATKSAPTAGGSAAGNSESANAGAGSLPAAISVSPAGAKPASGGVGRAANLIPNLSLKPVIPAEGARAEKAGPANVAALAPGAPPEKLLSGEMFTLHASTPNMTSTRGSWVLNVAQLGADPRPVYRPKGDLSGPLPIHTVDPRYPPETMDEHIEGEVVLYAIIRKDGSVDSIQVVRSLDPRLDKAAIAALAQWRFRPGSRAGEPVDLEAVVHVRFEYRRPNY